MTRVDDNGDAITEPVPIIVVDRDADDDVPAIDETAEVDAVGAAAPDAEPEIDLPTDPETDPETEPAIEQELQTEPDPETAPELETEPEPATEPAADPTDVVPITSIIVTEPVPTVEPTSAFVRLGALEPVAAFDNGEDWPAVWAAEVIEPARRPASSLEAVRLSAWYGDHKVLERVSLVMPPATVTALIGPSGCGKSTFLRILNRMHEETPGARMGGEVLLDGADVYAAGRRVTDTRRRIGMVFQKPNPFPAMSIADNVTAGLRLTGARLSRAARAEVAERCLIRAGLWAEVRDRLARPGGTLSGGQQQRLCIARSLAVDPDVLLMDEPCSALDPTSTRYIEETIAALSVDMTIVIVTHNMQQAARVSHLCAFFLSEDGAPGRIVETASTVDIFERPVDPRTADYVHGRFG
ncbi:MAG: phosphate transporter ATP-binding protein [Ilumatobacteraceae bacterium]|nr:phosphate transporter ATP-binding protein [Ilumatobacteraceae bacterium]